jgi:Flp pilus assembly protein TadD
MNLSFKEHNDKPRGAHYTIECYFDRAIRFAPTDGEVLALYGIYLARVNHKQDAVKAFERALNFEQQNPNVHYNLGLVYVDLTDYENAREQAHLAYKFGSQLPGLRDKLKQAHQWREPREKAAATEPARPTGKPE